VTHLHLLYLAGSVCIAAAPLFQQLVQVDPQALFSEVYEADVHEVGLAMEGAKKENFAGEPHIKCQLLHGY